MDGLRLKPTVTDVTFDLQGRSVRFSRKPSMTRGDALRTPITKIIHQSS